MKLITRCGWAISAVGMEEKIYSHWGRMYEWSQKSQDVHGDFSRWQRSRAWSYAAHGDTRSVHE